MPTSESSSSSSSDDADTALGMEFLPLELMLHAMEASLRKKSSKSKNKKRKTKRKHREETPGTGDEAGEAGPGLKPAAPRGPKRKRKRSAGASSVIESVADAAELIRNAKRIVVLCGAGISVSCGIPDFRSANGLYATLASLGLPVAEPEDLMDINTFVETPELFYSFAKRIWPDGSILPSLTHRFFKVLADKRKLLRVYTQNIDGLEEAAGVPKGKITYCHGHLRTARCLKCKRKASALELAPTVAKGQVPYCVKCPDGVGVMKPDMVFFGERISGDVVGKMTKESDKVDLVLVMGTSLAVAPISKVLDLLPPSVPRLLLNRDLIKNRCTTPLTAALLGDADATVHHLMVDLGWGEEPATSEFAEPPPIPKLVQLGVGSTDADDVAP